MTTIPRKCDIAVIGGGPSGSLASGLLSSKGYDVVLLEKAKHPRPTVGESLLPHFWRFTDMMGDASQRISEANFVQKGGAIIQWHGGFKRVRFKEFGHDRPPLHIDREAFDKILLDTSSDCGTQVFEEVTVKHVDVDRPLQKMVHYDSANGEDEGQLEAKYVVDASGQAAVIANQLGFREFDEELKFSAMWGYYRGSDYLDFEGQYHNYDDRFDSPPVTFIETIGDWGWCWNIPLRETVSIGLVIPPERYHEMKAKRDELDARFQQLVGKTRYVSKLLSDYEFIDGSVRVIRDYAYKPVKLATNDCYLVGDAAAFVDPINSAGVTFGMYAGCLAAWSIERAFKDPSKRELCQQMFEDQYRQRLQIFRLVALPTDRKLTDAEFADVCKAFRVFSDAEKQLALTTTILTNRPERLRSVLRELDISEQSICSEVPIPVELAC